VLILIQYVIDASVYQGRIHDLGSGARRTGVWGGEVEVPSESSGTAPAEV